MDGEISLRELLKIKGASRTVRAYAFLDATLTISSKSANPSRDVLDCFLPFVAAGITEQVGKQLDLSVLQGFLRDHFGFDIPLYALELFIPPLAEKGYLKYNKTIGRNICSASQDQFIADKRAALSEYGELEGKLAQYAQARGMVTPPASETWLDALVKFLKAAQDEAPPKTAPIKGVLISDVGRIEQYIIGQFIEAASKTDELLFAQILSIFKGVLVEDFIAGGIQAGAPGKVSDLTIFYDTSLLMRLLGCSGDMLHEATMEVHRYLQDVGAATEFLRVNEEEVSNMIQSILGAKDSGYAIYGETGEAIERGEYSVSRLRLLNGMFPEKLATLSVFPTKKTINAMSNPQRFQIDERGFEVALETSALKRSVFYKKDNRKNDAQALGATVLFRRGHVSNNPLQSRILFVTSNDLLAKASRKYLVDQGQLKWHECPPILQIGQLSTIVWLLNNRKFEDKLVGRELLASCYAAYRPEPEWLEEFSEAIGRATSLTEAGVESTMNDAMRLQAARRVALDQSYGRTALLRTLNMAEVLALADEQKQELASRSVQEGVQQGDAAATTRIKSAQHERARRYAARVIGVAKIGVIIAVLLAALFQEMSWAAPTSSGGLVWMFAFIVSVISLLDTFGVKLVDPFFNAARERLADRIHRFLLGEGS